MSLIPTVSNRDHSSYPIESSLVTIVEYGDYQCSNCRDVFREIEKLTNHHPQSFNLVWRHFPLQKLHEFAMLAAEAAEAAGFQGKFWEMHRLLFNGQHKLDRSLVYELAHELSLDEQVFEQHLREHTFREKVEADFESGIRSGVNGTPTIFIQGERYKGEKTAEELWNFLQPLVS